MIAFILGVAITSAIFYTTTTVSTTVYSTVYSNGDIISSSPSGCIVGTSANFCQSWGYVQNSSGNYVLYNCEQGSPMGTEFCESTTLYNSASASYAVLTVTEQIVFVILYTPTCTTISGRTTSTYAEASIAETTTVTFIYPSIPPASHVVSFTTVTNNTAIASNRTQTESTFSC